ncbi:MAG: hypothetical protein HFH44_14280 [Lachnospiraceae bacterium]|nr:hypothetical protein [Lachnospiraceae bacterium]
MSIVVAGKESFYQYKKELNEFSGDVKKWTNHSEQMINQQFSKKILKYASYVYDDMRFQVDCRIGKFTREEIEGKKACGTMKLKRCLAISDAEKISYQRLCNEVKRKGEPVLAFLEEYKKGIIDLYRQRVPILWHVSAVSGIQRLNPSIQRENMYYNDICDAVFATSSYDEVLLYLGRALGGEMEIIGNFCFYKKRPYHLWDDCAIQLKEQAAVYYLDVDRFLPVIDFIMTEQGKARLRFGHEWVCRGQVAVSAIEEIKMIPSKDMLRYQLYYGLKNICLAPYIDVFRKEFRLDKRKKYLQKLMDDKVIAYVNLL